MTEVNGRREVSKRTVLAVCCLALLIVTMDNTVVNVALPTISSQLHATSTSLQWVVDGYVLVLASLLLTSGSLGDRYGRRRIFQIGLVIFGAGSLACSLAPSLGTLIAFRALQGVGGSMLTPSTLSIVSNTYTEPAERARAIGLWSATSGLSIGIGPVLGGALVSAVGWRAVFWVNLPIVAIAMVAARRSVPESKAERARRLDPVGQLTAAAALALLTYTLIEAPAVGYLTLRTLGSFVATALLAGAFLSVERHRREPLLELGFFRNPPFAASVAVAFAAFVALFAFIFFNTLYLQEVRGDSALLAGILTLPATGLIVFSAPLSGRLTSTRGPRLPVTLACLLLTAGLLILLATTATSPLWLLVVGYLVFGLGIGLVNPPITNGAVAGMPREQAGVAAATTSTARQVGGVFGVALIGSIVFGGFASLARSRVAGLPPRLRAVAARAAHSSAGGASVHLTRLPGPVHLALGAAFTTAIHRGYAVAAVFALAAAAVGFFAMRHRQTEQQPAPAREPALPAGGDRTVTSVGRLGPGPAGRYESTRLQRSRDVSVAQVADKVIERPTDGLVNVATTDAGSGLVGVATAARPAVAKWWTPRRRPLSARPGFARWPQPVRGSGSRGRLFFL